MDPDYHNYIYADEVKKWLFCTVPYLSNGSVSIHEYLDNVLWMLHRSHYDACIIDISYGRNTMATLDLLSIVDTYMIPRATDYGLTYISLIVSSTLTDHIPGDEGMLLWKKPELQVCLFGRLEPAVRWLMHARIS